MILPNSLFLLLTLCFPANGADKVAANLEADEESSYGGISSNYFTVDEYLGNLEDDSNDAYTDEYYRQNHSQKRAIPGFLQA